ncbi:toxin [Leptospira abararensis]|uniref:toxin n=1 Tax=Leptospira abararensis TaxID=2810036 RepID=UPI001E527692|nr:toxin [Leptospira abararensis]
MYYVLTKGTLECGIGKVNFDWDHQKNKLLNSERNISFERIVIEIEAGQILDILEHSNFEKYPNQIIIIVNIDGYAWIVPAIENRSSFFLKTAYPSRKYSKIYFPEVD